MGPIKRPRQDIHQTSEQLDRETLIKGLGKSIFSQNLIIYQKINSTNVVAKDMATKGAPEGTIVIAEEQTAGKGRLDRRWLSNSHKNLLFTILLRPSWGADNIFLLTMMLAISAIDETKNIAGVDILIKWPNDLYVGKKKLAGVLTEFSMKEGIAEYVVLGLGINVNWMPGAHDGLLYPATSILAETGKAVSRSDLLMGLLKRFDIAYAKALSGKTDDVYERWNKLSMVIGQEVEIISQDEIIKGKAIAIDRTGALILKNNLGEEVKMLSGDVSLRF
jgi:BirA family transcriptional regulator, biotin operon repressor / biotin---[acetyl-CoA-carboxylase] ligase